MLWLQTQREQAGYFNLGGSLTRFLERDGPLGEAGVPVTTSHIVNIGRMVEVSLATALIRAIERECAPV